MAPNVLGHNVLPKDVSNFFNRILNECKEINNNNKK